MSDMKLSEQLQELNDCGDVGNWIEGYADKARALERRVEELEGEVLELVEDMAGEDI